jgi:hypothetical protein
MEPIVIAFGTALVGAIATGTWQQVREAVTGLRRRAHPQQVGEIGAELDDLREQVLRTRRDGDANTENDLEGVWRLRLQKLLRVDPAQAAELRRILD